MVPQYGGNGIEASTNWLNATTVRPVPDVGSLEPGFRGARSPHPGIEMPFPAREIHCARNLARPCMSVGSSSHRFYKVATSLAPCLITCSDSREFLFVPLPETA